MKIGERTLNNAVFNAGSSLVPLILSFVLWPYIVNKLGEAAYGIFALVGSVIGYFALLDLGLGNAVIKFVAEQLGRDDPRGAERIIQAALMIFLLLGLLGAIAIVLLAGPLAERWLKIPPDLVNVARISFTMAAAGFFFTMLLTLFTAVINGMNRYDITSLLTAGMGALTTIGSAIVLFFGRGLGHVVLLNVLMPLAAVMVYVLLIKRTRMAFNLKPRWDGAANRQILGFGMYALLGRITDVVVRQVDLLLIGAILGVSEVTYYVIPFTILNRMTVLISRTGVVIFPAISELQGQQRNDTIQELYLTTTRLILAVATSFCIPLLIFGPRFLNLWMSPEFAHHGGTVIRLITLGVYFDLWTNVPTFVVDGLGKPRISGLAAVSQAALFLSLLAPLAFWKGIIGVAAAFAISAGIVGPLFVWYVNHRIVNLSLARLFRESFARPLLTGLLVGVPLALVPSASINHLLVLMAVLAAGFFAYHLLALPLGIYQARERRIIMGYTRRVLHRIFRKKAP